VPPLPTSSSPTPTAKHDVALAHETLES
jgi:hypothetical protein